MSEIEARNPRAEATDLLPPGHEARVLEPSPPASHDPEWFADDPTDPGEAKGKLVTPIPGEGILWSDVAKDDPALRRYVAKNWLDGSRKLSPLPEGFDKTRDSLHQLAFFAIAPVRHAANGKLGLRYTRNGFGTPFFGEDEQVRVESGMLVHQQDHHVDSIVPKTLAEACDFLDISYREVWFEDFHDPLDPIGPDAVLEIDPDSARVIGDWFGFATLALERSRRIPGAADVSRVQLWPEHFDPAFEMGSYERGQRASYGASPGDDAHPEPYLYVGSWSEVDRNDPFWNDSTFNGASMSYSEILDSEDHVQTAQFFFRRGYERLTGKAA
ncbi:MAG: hypothetical protein ACLFVZ_05395 [Actinomycetota bacterium]